MVEDKSAVENALGDDLKIISKNLIKEAICGVFTKGHCDNSSYLFLESDVTEMIQTGVLKKAFIHIFNRWSQSDTFTRALFGKIVNDRVFIACVAALPIQRVINAVKKVRNSELPVTKEILSPPSRSPSASTGTTTDGMSKAR